MVLKGVKSLADAVAKSGAWKKLRDPSAVRGGTEWPNRKQTWRRLESDWTTTAKSPETESSTTNISVNPTRGRYLALSREWREANGGTHAVMADIFVKKDGTKEEVISAFKEGVKGISGV